MSDIPRAVVAPAADSRLAQLHALYAEKKAQADAAAREFKAIADAIKLELTAQAPEGSTRVVLDGDAGPRLALAYSERVTVDSKRLRSEQPAIYDHYSQKSGSWSLREAKGDE